MCKYCWRPANAPLTSETIVVDGVMHNPGCPVVEGNFEDWHKGYDWGFNNSTESWRYWPDGSIAFRYGIRAGQNEMEGLVEQAAEDEYYGVHEREY